MRLFLRQVNEFFSTVAISEKEKFYRSWDFHRDRAMTPSERNEIDAIFARHT